MRASKVISGFAAKVTSGGSHVAEASGQAHLDSMNEGNVMKNWNESEWFNRWLELAQGNLGAGK